MEIDYTYLRKKSKKPTTGLPEIKIAILGDSATQFFVSALKGFGIEKKVHFNIYEADYDMMTQEIHNLNSSLYEFQPEFIVLIPSSEKLLKSFYHTAIEGRSDFSQITKSAYQDKISILESNLSTKVILFNFPLVFDGVFGHFSNKITSSFSYQLRKLNLELMSLANENGNLFLFDMDAIQNRFGIAKRIDAKFYYTAQMVFSLDILPVIVKELTDIILAIKGTQLRKCLILDLDNTTWGGVIGDDGMEGILIGNLDIGKAFSELQSWAKELKNRGIILAVCSKNTDHIAKEPFEKHPDMVLRLEDISVFVANWENKADNIRHIKNVLNIGYDSMVFLDDNPFERNLVRQELPEILVPELPEDPTLYMNFIYSLNLFETASHSGEDKNRTKRYQEEAKRVNTKQTYQSISDYLESLQMESDTRPFEKFYIPRIAQLTQRSNQFNLRTKRYTEAEITEFQQDQNYITLQVSLKDKFGTYGLISVIIGEIRNQDLFIDTWIMSCRVLKRDVEKFVTNELVTIAKDLGLKRIVGEYLPTPKNVIVKDHYKKLGFLEQQGLWCLSVADFQYFDIYINSAMKELL